MIIINQQGYRLHQDFVPKVFHHELFNLCALAQLTTQYLRYGILMKPILKLSNYVFFMENSVGVIKIVQHPIFTRRKVSL